MTYWLPFLGAGEVEPVAVAVGDGFVVFLDVGKNFVVELRLEACGVGHCGGCVGVFGFKVGDDFGRAFFAEPGVIVHELSAVDGNGFGFATCERGRCERGKLLSHSVSINRIQGFVTPTGNAAREEGASKSGDACGATLWAGEKS